MRKNIFKSALGLATATSLVIGSTSNVTLAGVSVALKWAANTTNEGSCVVPTKRPYTLADWLSKTKVLDWKATTTHGITLWFGPDKPTGTDMTSEEGMAKTTFKRANADGQTAFKVNDESDGTAARTLDPGDNLDGLLGYKGPIYLQFGDDGVTTAPATHASDAISFNVDFTEPVVRNTQPIIHKFRAGKASGDVKVITFDREISATLITDIALNSVKEDGDLEKNATITPTINGNSIILNANQISSLPYGQYAITCKQAASKDEINCEFAIVNNSTLTTTVKDDTTNTQVTVFHEYLTDKKALKSVSMKSDQKQIDVTVDTDRTGKEDKPFTFVVDLPTFQEAMVEIYKIANGEQGDQIKNGDEQLFKVSNGKLTFQTDEISSFRIVVNEEATKKLLASEEEQTKKLLKESADSTETETEDEDETDTEETADTKETTTNDNNTTPTTTPTTTTNNTQNSATNTQTQNADSARMQAYIARQAVVDKVLSSNLKDLTPAEISAAVDAVSDGTVKYLGVENGKHKVREYDTNGNTTDRELTEAELKNFINKADDNWKTRRAYQYGKSVGSGSSQSSGQSGTFGSSSSDSKDASSSSEAKTESASKDATPSSSSTVNHYHHNVKTGDSQNILGSIAGMLTTGFGLFLMKRKKRD